MNTSINKIGFWSGIFAFAATVSYCIVQSFQILGLIVFPFDEQLIYGTSLLIVLPFLLMMLCLHYTMPAHKKFWTHGALLFATLYAAFVSANYLVQLVTVIPMTLQGRLDEVRVLQQTPQSLFWNYDALGYIFMGLAAAIAIPAFSKTGHQKWVRISLIAHALVTPLISIVYFYPDYSYSLLLLGFPWAVTAPTFMLLLALMFRKNMNLESSGTDRRAIKAVLLENMQPVQQAGQ